MTALIKRILRPIYEYIFCREFRQYINLLSRYKKVPRYQKKRISFLEYSVIVLDCLSFICQFEEIWLDKVYMFKTANHDPLIYDCGSNIGMSILFFKKMFPGSIIKAFEADPTICSVLSRNLEMNKITGVEVINRVVGVNYETVEFGCESGDGGSIYLKSGMKLKVKSLRLKDYISREKSIDMLKIDIEGAELELIKDIKDELVKVSNLFIEYHSLSSREQSLDQILAILTNQGFRYYIKTVSERKIPFINTAPNDHDMDLQVNIFAYRR